MGKRLYIILLFLLATLPAFSQVDNARVEVEIRGSVKGKENYTPISGVQISTNKGSYARTNSLGEFKIKAAVGDIIVFESPEIETVRHRITSEEDIDVFVEGYGDDSASKREKRETTSVSNTLLDHQRCLDSANQYKKTDLE